MRRLYSTPDIEFLLFDEEEVLTDSTSYTAAQDVNSQLETILKQKTNGSISTVKLEDVKVK